MTDIENGNREKIIHSFIGNALTAYTTASTTN